MQPPSLSPRIAETLARQDYCALEGFLTADELKALTEDLVFRDRAGFFQPAGIGQSAGRQLDASVRRDRILWLESPGGTPAQQALWTRLESLREALNRALLLGLWDFEGHYAVYPEGGFYRRHLDVFRGDDRRAVSLILYLNPAWSAADGGQLRLHLSGGPVDIEPRGGTLACFLSREVEHEVLPARAERLSFTGWFRRRPASR